MLFAMHLCDLFLSISAVSSFGVLSLLWWHDRAACYVECDSRLFWCKKCGEFYLRKKSIDICECPKCGGKNSKLTF
jgi:Zn finger protein HypA/HybF involved in hydrogenase expression